MSENRFLRLWEFFAWADRARWNGEQSSSRFKWLLNNVDGVWIKDNLKITSSNLEPSDIILAHWLTYIFDYGMPVEQIWERGFPVMAYISYCFRRGASSEVIMKKNYRPFEFFIKDYSFKHRFLKAHGLDKKVVRTLAILENSRFARDLVAFCLQLSDKAKDEEWIKKVACGLYALTYDEKLKEPLSVLLDADKFDRYYKSVRSKLWHKRLWAAFRDYLKELFYRKYFLKALTDYKPPVHILNRWRNPRLYLYQLELPGDIWNIRFYRNCIEPLLPKNIRLSKTTPKAIRQLYEHYRDDADKLGLYPEQFDVTFDFARICEQGLCQICPLSHTGARMLCIGELEARDKYCPVLASACEYYVKCEPKECPVFNGKTKGLCPNSRPLA